jgi:hypothetical protein
MDDPDADGAAVVPWDRGSPVAGLGFDTVAFDVAETGVRTARERFPDWAVQYLVADLLNSPAGRWRAEFRRPELAS